MKNKCFGFLLLSQTFTMSNFLTGPMEIRDGGCQLYIIKPHKKSILPYKSKHFLHQVNRFLEVVEMELLVLI